MFAYVINLYILNALSFCQLSKLSLSNRLLYLAKQYKLNKLTTIYDKNFPLI